MVCQFCKQDVDQPCQDTHEMEQRANDHIDRCEKAFDSQKDASQGQSGGSI